MSAPTPAEGTVIADAYRIVRPLSAGGMGAVYVAEQLSTGKLRALKLMHHRLQEDPKLRERFTKEARVAASIESAHVVEVIGAGVEADSGTPWLAMELLDGEDLAAHLTRCGALSPSRTLELLEQIGHALGEAHDAGIVHRDLKPENVFIAESKAAGQATTVKILDFGIAKLVADAQTMGTAAIGSPAWMAPEQAESSASITPSTDVWAVGLLTFWMLTGASYWRAAAQPNPSMHAFLKQVLFDALPLASKRAAELGVADRLPEGFDDWFDRSVHREPRARFRSAREQLAAFRALLDSSGEPGPASDAEAGAEIEPVPMSTQAFISSGELGALGLSEDPAPGPSEPGESASELADERAEDDPEPPGPDAMAAADDVPRRPDPEDAVPHEPSEASTPAPGRTVISESARVRRAPATPAPAADRPRARPWWALAILLAGGVAIALAWRSLAPSEPVRGDRTATTSTGSPTAAASESAEERTELAEGGPASGGAGAAGSGGHEAASLEPTGTAPAAGPRPGRPSPGASAAEQSTAASADSADAGPERPAFNRFLAEGRVKQRARTAERQCAARDGPRSIALTLVFGGDGRVKQTGVPLRIRTTSSGACVDYTMRTLMLGPFSGPDQTISITVNLP